MDTAQLQKPYLTTSLRMSTKVMIRGLVGLRVILPGFLWVVSVRFNLHLKSVIDTPLRLAFQAVYFPKA